MSFNTDLTFTLGRNNKGDNPKRPDYRGEVFIDGKVYKLSGWIRTAKATGKTFISGRLQLEEPKQYEQPQEPANTPPPAASSSGLAEDVPF